MKKILLTSLVCAAAFGAGAANAAYDADDYNVKRSVFNPTFRPGEGDWAFQGGVMFRTGPNSTGTNQSNFESGDFQVDDVKIAFGVLDELYVSFDVYADTFEVNPYTGAFNIGAFANPEVGVNWQIFRPAKSFALDLIGKYGLAWTKDAATNQRIGMNNLQAGARIYGDEGKFQWGGQALLQMAFLPDNSLYTKDEMWNLLMRAEIEFEIVEKVGLRGEFNYNMYNMNNKSGEAVIYDRYVQLGAIWDLQPGAAVQPYVAYHIATANSENSSTLPNDYWQVGAKFGLQF